MKAIPDNAELQQETKSIIQQLLDDGSDPNALYIIEHHISHYDFEKLEKIAVDVFKAGYEVSDAEEFQDENGKLLFSFDAISEIELNEKQIFAQQQELMPLISKFNGIYDGWGTYFEDPNAT
ncbi:ribonuclease E inhibitor RraB, partial [Avibacterium avium]|uniref:ribonuclease E inhibitor RraB n=1 Tax=Avibacterium avium TaxID=751 RepID=UPI003BF7FAC0